MPPGSSGPKPSVGLRVPPIRSAVPLIALFVLGCGSTPALPTGAPSVTPPATIAPATGTPVASPRELAAGSATLPPGRYTRTTFRPPITFELEDGWVAGTVSDGFFDVQRDPGSPDVIAVQFAVVEGVVGADAASEPTTTARAGVAAIQANPALTVMEASESRLGGLTGSNVVVQNAGTAHADILDVSLGTLGIDPGRRLWISMFDTADGVLAVMVGGSVAQWERALTLAEPVLESVVVGAAAVRAIVAEPSGWRVGQRTAEKTLAWWHSGRGLNAGASASWGA